MSESLNPLSFPLNGTRLIEASAGTGKTWTIAALYLRLVLGHGDAQSAYHRPLQPAEILVMTFTNAATRELSDRIRERLVEAAQYFRAATPQHNDPYLAELLKHYHDDPARREQAAYRLALAAEAMDESAVFTIDAWCQRVLREHAIDSGTLFDEELVQSERELYNRAVRDYWRNHVYALADESFDLLYGCWNDLTCLDKDVRDLVKRAHLLDQQNREDALDVIIERAQRAIHNQLAPIKADWVKHTAELKSWFARNRDVISKGRYQVGTVNAFFLALEEWTGNAAQVQPGAGFDKAWDKWHHGSLNAAINGGCALDSPPPPAFGLVSVLKEQLCELPRLKDFVQAHAAVTIAHRIQALKTAAGKYGFVDLLTRLKAALEGKNGVSLRQRIVARYPVAMIDEFQDTSPDQYRIFDMLYDVSRNDAAHGLFLIGDPKQAIYGFRGADIHSYLAARRATEGRHYRLGKNFRSTTEVVQAVNQLFMHAEGEDPHAGHPKGAFGFRDAQGNALPFHAVGAQDRADRLISNVVEVPAMTMWVGAPEGYGTGADTKHHFAQLCAEQIVTLLNDASVGFRSAQGIKRLQAADIAILVRDRYEAAAIQQALHTRDVLNVYLSDSDSVFESDEAADVLRWLQAVANPFDASVVRCAFATRTADVPLVDLAALTVDDLAWETRVEQLKALKQVWQRHGVLAMLRRFLHELQLPQRLLPKPGGERSLTNLLHLAELLQRESQHLDGEQGLIRWLAEQIDSSLETGDEHVLRLESDAQLVKIVTVHKSKGLEYPLVFLPFAATCRPVNKKKSYVEYLDPQDGLRKVSVGSSDKARVLADQARLEEEIRLLYVALTRARHALWLGVAYTKESFHKSALAYLANSGADIADSEFAAVIATMAGTCAHINVLDAPAEVGSTRLTRVEALPPLRQHQTYRAGFERGWAVASYSSISKGLVQVRAPATPAEQKMQEHDEDVASCAPVEAAVWHRFARGAMTGNYLHELLQWMVEEGLDNADQDWYREQLIARCERSVWKARKEEVADWLLRVVLTPLPALGVPLSTLRGSQAETEFWVPTAHMQTAELDRLCGTHLMPGLPRPPLSERELSGMLHGFIDLVFEHEGRYWILDYKSTALGDDDAAYHAAALERAVVSKRYEVQGVIYLLALHRLLKSRLGPHYVPSRHLGGALFLFLRGVGNSATRGCCPLPADLTLLDALDQLLPAPQLEVAL